MLTFAEGDRDAVKYLIVSLNYRDIPEFKKRGSGSSLRDGVMIRGQMCFFD